MSFWNVLREQYKFIVLVSATDELAEDLADFIRLEFTDNKRILEDFGQLLMGIGASRDFLVNKTKILARGRKQDIRGFRSRQHRPDLIILDNIEKEVELIQYRSSFINPYGESLLARVFWSATWIRGNMDLWISYIDRFGDDSIVGSV